MSCALVVDTDGLSGGSATNRGSSSSDGSTLDGGAGGSETGGSTVGPERGTATETCAGTGSERHTLCDDFDDPLPLSRWTRESSGASGITGGVTSSEYVSSGRALHVTFGPGDGDGSSSYVIARELPVKLTSVVCEFDVKIAFRNTPASRLAAGLFTMYADSGPGASIDEWGLAWRVAETGSQTMYENYTEHPGNDPQQDPVPLQPPPKDTWTHVVWRLDFSGRTFALDVNGARAATATITPPDKVTRIAVTLGGDADESVYAGGIDAYFDNLFCDAVVP